MSEPGSASPNPYESPRTRPVIRTNPILKRSAQTLLGCSVFPACIAAFVIAYNVVANLVGVNFEAWNENLSPVLGGLVATGLVFGLFWIIAPRRQRNARRTTDQNFFDE